MHRTEREGRVSRVMRSLLDVMKGETGTLTLQTSPCRPADLAAEAIARVAPLAAEKELVLDGLVGEIGHVVCDRARIVEVLTQLLTNAIDASPSHEAVVVRAEEGQGEIVLSVSDKGEGIDVTDWPYIFDGAWQAASGKRKGLGLGLALAKAVVHAHGGNIWAQSRRGEGTTFAFSLPRPT
jgi:signal transduction histidine kinase